MLFGWFGKQSCRQYFWVAISILDRKEHCNCIEFCCLLFDKRHFQEKTLVSKHRVTSICKVVYEIVPLNRAISWNIRKFGQNKTVDWFCINLLFLFNTVKDLYLVVHVAIATEIHIVNKTKKSKQFAWILWQGQKDSNPQGRFWRPECYHYIMPLNI